MPMLHRCFFLLSFLGTVTVACSHQEPNPNTDWESFGFSLNGVQTDTMWVSTMKGDDKSYPSDSKDCLLPFGNLHLSPAATILNYGQGLFEGLKAFRRSDGSVAVFRPELNAERMRVGARRFLMQPVPVATFLRAVEEVVRSNARWIPPQGKGALYLRPLLFGSGAGLGVKPSSEYTFCVYCSPVGNYFKGGLNAIALQAVKGYARAAPGSSGAVKAVGNYAPAFKIQHEVKQRGYDEALFLDALESVAIEEAGASNFFAVFPNNTLVTPALSSETILPGVTRASIIEIAEKELQLTVVEGSLTLDDLQEAVEAFCCGTGASITPVGSISVTSKQAPNAKLEADVIFGDGKTPGYITRQLWTVLSKIQMGTDSELCRKYSNWIHLVPP